MTAYRIRPASAADAAVILRFIRELAIYEKAESSVQTDEAGIRASLFGADAKAQALVCERDGVLWHPVSATIAATSAITV